MFRRLSFLLAAAIFIVTNLTPVHAFHGGQGSGGLNASADTHSGSAGFSVPIDVPPGRAGIQPNIQLRYNSSLPNGLLGVGWSLELGSIQRSTKKGVPSYTDNDTYVLVQDGSSQELVFDQTAGFYRAKTEGAFLKIQKNGNGWVVTDKKGTKYYFGEAASSQEFNSQNAGNIFKWFLNRVEDLQGNTMTITYWRDGDKAYPQFIDYTSNPSGGIPGFAQVEFIWNPRNDRIFNYAGGYKIQTYYRLEQINVSVENILQYRFALNYHQSNATRRSLLQSITQYGADGTTVLPPLTFQYQEYLNEPAPAYNLASGPDINPNNQRLFGDFNGDGRTDRGLFDRNAGAIYVELSNGNSFSSPTLWRSQVSSNITILTGNFNSDGATDVCFFSKTSGKWETLLSQNDNAFGDPVTWLTGFGTDRDPTSGDFNGDGLSDIAYWFPDGSANLRGVIALNAGGSFVEMPAATPIISNPVATGITGDFNGDGLTDFGMFNTNNGCWEIRLNPGNINAPFVYMTQICDFGRFRQPVVADFNSDGLTDIGYYEISTGNIEYRTSNGDTFDPAQSISINFNLRTVETQGLGADFNGDGLPDLGAINGYGNMELAYSSGVAADLLAKSNNGVGGTTTIEYAPSTSYAANTKIPFPLHLVKSATQSNNLGDVYATRYEYKGGLWDGVKREFRGFATVKVIDPEGSYGETDFLQDEILYGRPSEQRVYDNANRLFSKTVSAWANEVIIPGVNFITLKRQDNFVYDGDATGKRTAQEFFYEETPQRGNMTKTVQLGEVNLTTDADVPGDTRTVETFYVNNPTNWVLGLPRQTTVKNNAGQIVRQSWFYYDNQASNTALPVKGLLTKKEDWAGGAPAVNPVTQYSYDTIGNLLTTTDPKGNITRITYDTTYKIFPLQTENALTHKVTNEYYGVNGVGLTGSDGLSGLWGQLRATTDPNQQQGKRGYDVFGRLTTTVGPLDSVQYPTQTSSIEYGTNYTKTTARRRIKSGEAPMVETVSFYDGLGRLVQTKSPTEVTGRYTVSGQARYNSRGLVSEQYLPFFSTQPVNFIEPIVTTRPHSTIEYDAVGRAVKTTNADGTFASGIYDDWSTESIDENGHKQKSWFDAYGRLIKKEEFIGADGRSPHYSAVPYTLYAATLYSYDSEGNLVQTKDAYNNTTTITYDKLGRKIEMNDPDMGTWKYSYDLNGNLTQQIDAKGKTLTFTYDALNRLKNKTDGVSGTVNVNYTYDTATVTNAKGRLTQAGYTAGNTQFAYDQLGRELQSIKTINTNSYQVNRGYNALNNLMEIKYPDQKNIHYKYTPAGQIEAISNDPALLPQSMNLLEEKTEQLAFKSEIRSSKSQVQ